MKEQYSFWHKEHQVLVTPIEQTLRDPEVYSFYLWVFAPSRETILQKYIDTDEVFWKDLCTKDKVINYSTRWIDNNGDWDSDVFDDVGAWEEG